jgi:hypothetical protein
MRSEAPVPRAQVTSAGSRTINPWIVALVVVVPTLVGARHDDCESSVLAAWRRASISSTLRHSMGPPTSTSLRASRAAVGPFALLRNEGGSAGTSLGQTIAVRRDQFHSFGLEIP